MLNAETTVSNVDDYRYYADEGKVAYQAVRVGKDEYKYSNASISRWTAMQGNDVAMTDIETLIESELGSTEGINFKLSDSESYEYTIGVVYSSNKDMRYSYRELQQTVPDWVNTTVHYRNYTTHAVMPVDVQEESYEAGSLVGKQSKQLNSGIGTGGWVETLFHTVAKILPF